MLSFRSILIAPIAFAAITSAIPTHSDPIVNNKIVNVVIGDHTYSTLVSASGEFDNAIPSLEDLDPAATSASGLPNKRGQPSSLGDILQTCYDAVELVVLKIDAAVNVDDGTKIVNHDLVIDLLEEIVVSLQVALKDLNEIIVAEPTLNGVGCTLAELASVVAGLLILVIKVVWLVLCIVGSDHVPLCGVIASIGVLLCELLEVVLALVDDLKVEVAVLMQPFVDQCNLACFTQILVILDLHA